jgi:hypothetical protein
MTTSKREKYDWQRLRDQIADNDNPVMLLVATLIFIVLAALALKLIALNIAPYLSLLGAPEVKPSNIPIVGWGYDLLNLLYVGTGACILWGLIQTCQITWILISLDRKAQRAAVKASQREAASMGEGYDRDRVTRQVRRRAVRLPFFFMAASGYIALAAYVAEAIINFKAFPPVKNFQAFIAGMTIGDVSPIDFNNVLTNVWNMFSTEFLVIALIVVGQWIWSHRSAEND